MQDLGKKLKRILARDRILIQEALKDKSKLREKENIEFNNKVFLLRQEIFRKRKELNLYFQQEFQKIQIMYQQKIREIDL